MKLTDKLAVFYHDRKVGELRMTPDNTRCAFQYEKEWLAGYGRYKPYHGTNLLKLSD